MAILLKFCITNIIFMDNVYIYFFRFMETEIHSFLRYLGGTDCGSGAVLGSGEVKVNELDSDCKEASVCGEAGDGDATYDALIKGYPESCVTTRSQLLLCSGMAGGFPSRAL